MLAAFILFTNRFLNNFIVQWGLDAHNNQINLLILNKLLIMVISMPNI